MDSQQITQLVAILNSLVDSTQVCIANCSLLTILQNSIWPTTEYAESNRIPLGISSGY